MILTKRQLYRRTVNGLVTQMYSNQKVSSKKRGHTLPNYTREEFYKWLLIQTNFKSLYNNWVKSNYKHDIVPSVDRINDYKPYTFENIQLVIWKDNYRKYYKDVRSGVNNKKSKFVFQFNLSGILLKKYNSVGEAGRCTKLKHISEVATGKRKTAGGFIWKYNYER